LDPTSKFKNKKTSSKTDSLKASDSDYNVKTNKNTYAYQNPEDKTLQEPNFGPSVVDRKSNSQQINEGASAYKSNNRNSGGFERKGSFDI
jgi:hypothetical protein